MSKLQRKVALVTGASKGIGAGIARELAAVGAAVVVNYASDRTGAESVVDAITAGGGRAIAIQADVAKSADVAELFERAKETFGSLDILVNNAGVTPLGRMGTPRDIAKIVSFLASDDSGWLTGEVILASGGLR